MSEKEKVIMEQVVPQKTEGELTQEQAQSRRAGFPDKYAMSYQNKLMLEIIERANSQSNNIRVVHAQEGESAPAHILPVVSETNGNLPPNIIPQRIAQAANAVQQNVNLQAAREIKAKSQ